MFVGQSQSLAPRIDKFRAGFAMRFVGSGNFRNAFADERVRDDELRFPVVALFRDV